MRALVGDASGGLGSAFVTLLAANARFSQVTAWSRSAAVVVDDKIFPQRVDLCDEATIEMAARTLGEVDLAAYLLATEPTAPFASLMSFRNTTDCL